MSRSTFAVVRILVLLLLAAGEVAGLIHYHGQAEFPGFLVLSLWLVFLVVPLLWIGAFWRRGVSYLHIAIVSVFGFWAVSWCIGGELVYGLLAAVAFLAGVIRLVRKMMRPVDEDRQDAYFRTVKPADVSLFHVAANTFGLLACFVCWAKMWPYPDLKMWSLLLVVPALWFAWRVVHRLFVNSGADADVTQIN